MNIDLNFLEPYLIYIVSGFIVLLILYLRSFFQESGKIAALKRKNKELVEKKLNQLKRITSSILKSVNINMKARKNSMLIFLK